jgi:hypothetical protein
MNYFKIGGGTLFNLFKSSINAQNISDFVHGYATDIYKGLNPDRILIGTVVASVLLYSIYQIVKSTWVAIKLVLPFVLSYIICRYLEHTLLSKVTTTTTTQPPIVTYERQVVDVEDLYISEDGPLKSIMMGLLHAGTDAVLDSINKVYNITTVTT